MCTSVSESQESKQHEHCEWVMLWVKVIFFMWERNEEGAAVHCRNNWKCLHMSCALCCLVSVLSCCMCALYYNSCTVMSYTSCSTGVLEKRCLISPHTVIGVCGRNDKKNCWTLELCSSMSLLQVHLFLYRIYKHISRMTGYAKLPVGLKEYVHELPSHQGYILSSCFSC